MANIDPLVYRQRSPDLVNQHGLTLWDLEREFPTGGFGSKPIALPQHPRTLRESYADTGFEYMHIADPVVAGSVESRSPQELTVRSEDTSSVASTQLRPSGPADEVHRTEALSLEGGESRSSCSTDPQPVRRHRPRRGRHRHGPPRSPQCAHEHRRQVYAQIFREFDGTMSPDGVRGSGDVSTARAPRVRSPRRRTPPASVAANQPPRAVDPVLEGIVRAKRDVIDQGGIRFHRLPVLVHGVQHSLRAWSPDAQPSERAATAGGTVHVIINNQVRFTTPPPRRSSFTTARTSPSRSTPRSSTSTAMTQAVVRAARLAFEYRQEFTLASSRLVATAVAATTRATIRR